MMLIQAVCNSLLPFLQFQSTLGYLKNPPKGYLLPGVDVISGFIQMRQKLRNGGYKSQYEFTSDISGVVSCQRCNYLFTGSSGCVS
jgi:hypothetical protein